MNNQQVIMREQSRLQRALALTALRSMVQRIEAGQNSEDALADAIHKLYADAADEGDDVAVLRRIVRLRKCLASELDKWARRECAVPTSPLPAPEARA